MKQHIAHGISASTYSASLERVWSEWEPMLRTAERLLIAGSVACDDDPEGGAQLLRRVQYRAHTSAGLVSSLQAPMRLADPHEYLVHTLENVRETMGMLAVRAELGELDEHSAELGLQHAMSTREAFHAIRSSERAAWSSGADVEPMLLPAAGGTEHFPGTRGSMLLWGLVAVCSALFLILLVQVLLLSNPV
jgi:hypothetical protein